MSTIAELAPEVFEAEQRAPLLREALDGALRAWRWVLGGMLAGALLGVPLAFALPLWFQADVRMIPTPSHNLPPKMPGFEPLDGATPEDISGPGGAEGAAELGRLLSILHSRSLTDDTIARFGLMEAYRQRTIEDMRDLFWNRLAQGTLVAKEGYVELAIEDKDPLRAAAMANFMAAEANAITRKLSSAVASEERLFLEHRLTEAHRDMDGAAQAVRDFQERQKLVNIDVQADGVMGMLLRLKEQLVTQEIELKRLQSFAAKDEPQTNLVRRQVRALRQQIETLQKSSPSGQTDFFTRLDAVPGLRQESDRLSRDLRLKTGVYELLLRQYEVAKLAEVRDTRSFELLDTAVVPTKKSRPSRGLVVIGLALAGLALAASLAGARAVVRHLRAA
jgi:uncharacterized protein involved in exopolysaccharide biosynthesis